VKTTTGVALLVVAVSLLVRPAAAAPPVTPASAPAPLSGDAARERAQELLADGNRMLDQGLYLEALERFLHAFRIFPSPKLHFNLASTYAELGRQLEALDHFEAFVRAVPKEELPALRALAHRRIFALLGAIATVQIHADVTDAAVTADGRLVGHTPLAQPLRFSPGDHAIIVAKPGHETQVVRLALKRGDAITRRVSLPTEEEAAATRRAVRRAEQDRLRAQEWLRLAEEEALRKRQRTRRLLRGAGLGAAVAGVALLACGVSFAALSRVEAAKVDDARSGTPWREVSGSYGHARTYGQVTAYTAGFGAALALGGGALLWLTRRDPTTERLPSAPPTAVPPRLTARPVLGPGQLGLALTATF
jgi:tetratricopeptide (TPR) repeat protein